MEILSFDIAGKFAHFRKFHGNNTAMSYSIPPRTTIIGMLAALQGEGKDGYYQKYRAENIRVGIRVLDDIKKSFHRLNYLRIKSEKGFQLDKKGNLLNNSKYFSGYYSRSGADTSESTGPIQTPFEVITGNNLKEDLVKYRIYLAPGEDDELFFPLKEQLVSGNRHYNISLGIAGFSASISNVKTFNVDSVSIEDEWIDIHSACNSEQVSNIDFPEEPEIKFNHIEEELLPADFIGGEKGRELHRMNRVLFSTRPFPVHVKLSGDYYPLKREKDEIENIQFLEYAGVFSQ